MKVESSSFSLDGRHIFITGGASPTGAAIVREALRAGARVSFVDIDSKGGEELFAELSGGEPQLIFHSVDVTDFSRLEAVFNDSVAKFGPVRGVVNNANVYASYDAVEMSESEWERLFGVDLKSIWYTSKLALPAMREAREGSIVNIGSIHASQTSPGDFPYSAAKSAVLGMTRNLAIDEGQNNIRTNTLSLGTQSDADPSKIAKVVIFLLSDGASFVNGSNWPVDGGLSARSAS